MKFHTAESSSVDFFSFLSLLRSLANSSVNVTFEFLYKSLSVKDADRLGSLFMLPSDADVWLLENKQSMTERDALLRKQTSISGEREWQYTGIFNSSHNISQLLQLCFNLHYMKYDQQVIPSKTRGKFVL